MKTIAASLLCLLFASLLASCSQRSYADKQVSQRLLAAPEPCAAKGCLAAASAKAAADLAAALQKNAVAPETRIIALSFVNVDDLARSSTLGRVLAEQTASGLADQGFAVVDLKAREPVVSLRPDTGELGLSRSGDLEKLTEGQAVLSGTYAVAVNTVFVDARVIRNADQVVVAGVSFELPVTQNVRRLLADELPFEPQSGLTPTVATLFPTPGAQAAVRAEHTP